MKVKFDKNIRYLTVISDAARTFLERSVPCAYIEADKFILLPDLGLLGMQMRLFVKNRRFDTNKVIVMYDPYAPVERALYITPFKQEEYDAQISWEEVGQFLYNKAAPKWKRKVCQNIWEKYFGKMFVKSRCGCKGMIVQEVDKEIKNESKKYTSDVK